MLLETLVLVTRGMIMNLDAVSNKHPLWCRLHDSEGVIPCRAMYSTYAASIFAYLLSLQQRESHVRKQVLHGMRVLSGLAYQYVMTYPEQP